ncbi:TRAP transporter small permease [Bacillus sp. B15-48]|uniref:TRAP transporter small permease n=1 Tax=Bacillus sp. B15-48 TaxID=1548601 RepID=UPI00193F2048|nr:TRAP transporter small permease [Bacillus sp. B15-48]MBM4760961.1 TRAP transporter small permease subunit [Bacillus sp. B15-48]
MVTILKAINLKLNNVMLSLAGTSLVVSMLLVVFNGTIRTFTNPYSGIIETVSWLAAITTAFSLGSAQISKTHVYIDLLFNKFNALFKKIIGVIVTVLALAFFILLMTQLIQYGISLKDQGVLSSTLRIPYYPFIIVTAVGIFGLIFTLFVELIEILFGKEKDDES